MASDHKSHEQDIIERYIERLLAVDGQRNDHSLTDDDLRQVARELGLSDDDLARVDEVVDDHLTRSRGFAERGLFAEAAAELHQALVLRPFDAAIAAELAHVHYRDYEHTKDRGTRETALGFAARALRLDPENQSIYELMRHDRDMHQRHKARPGLVLLGLAVMIGLTALVLVRMSDKAEKSSSEQTSGSGSEASQVVSPLTSGGGVATRPASPERDVPMTVSAHQTEGLDIQVQRSRMRDFGHSFSYNVDATIAASGSEIGLVQGRLQLLGEDGQVVRDKNLVLHDGYKPPLRPGDATPVHHLIFEKNPPPDIASARIHVDLVDRSAAAESYDAGPEIQLVWPDGQPAHIDVVVRERSSEVRKGLGKSSHWLVLSCENRGKRPVARLEIAVALQTEDGSPINTSVVYMVPSTGPSMTTGQTWVRRAITEIGPEDPPADKRFARYQLRVLAAE